MSAFYKRFRNLFCAFIYDNSNLLFYLMYRNDFWKLRLALNNKNNWFRKSLYYSVLQTNNSWISEEAKIESMPIFPHGLNGIFISKNAIIGKNCVIFQQVTIGSNTSIGSRNGSPTIGDNVYIGSGAKIIGPVNIGDGCHIGANAIVTCDVPPNSVCVMRGLDIITRDYTMDNTFISPQ